MPLLQPIVREMQEDNTSNSQSHIYLVALASYLVVVCTHYSHLSPQNHPTAKSAAKYFTGHQPKDIHNLRLGGIHRIRRDSKLRPEEARRARQRMPQHRQARHEIQCHDAQDESRSGSLRMLRDPFRFNFLSSFSIKMDLSTN